MQNLKSPIFFFFATNLLDVAFHIIIFKMVHCLLYFWHKKCQNMCRRRKKIGERKRKEKRMANFNLYFFFLECYYPELNTNILRKIEYFQDKPDLKKTCLLQLAISAR